MTDEAPTTGTPAQDGGDAAATQTTGTPETDGRNAEGGINREEALVWKGKAEKLNAVEREAAEAKARAANAEAEVERLRRAQSPAASHHQVDPRQQALRDSNAWAQGKDGLGPDPVAITTVNNAVDLEIIKQQLAEREALSEIDDKAMRKKVKEHLEANRHRLGDVDAARAEIEVESIEDKNAEIARLNAALRAAQAPTGNAPPTHHQPVPASTLKAREYETLEDFMVEKNKARNNTLASLELDRQVAAGEIIIRRHG